MYLFCKKDEICGFLLDPIVAHSSADEDAFEHIVSKETKRFMNFVHSYLCLLGICFVLYIISTLPMFSDGRKLPFFTSFTLVGKYSSILYVTAYAFVLSEILIGFTCTAVNVIIWFVMFNYGLEYRVLGHQFRNLNVNKVIDRKLQGCNISPEATTVKLFQQNCIGLFKFHQNVYGYDIHQLNVSTGIKFFLFRPEQLKDLNPASLNCFWPKSQPVALPFVYQPTFWHT